MEVKRKADLAPIGTSGTSIQYTGGKVTFGNRVYTIADGNLDFSSFYNQRIFVSIIESNGAAIFSQDTGSYHLNVGDFTNIKMGTYSTGNNTAQLGTANCPATTTDSPYTWIQFQLTDGSTVWVPAFK